MNERECRRIVAERSQGVCEARLADVCKGRATDMSHRLARSQGGKWTPANILAVCGPGNAGGCHGLISNRRHAGEAGGWRLPRGSEPTALPVLHGDLGWVLLVDDGTVIEVCPYCLELCGHPDECGAELDEAAL